MQDYNFFSIKKALDDDHSIIFPTETVYGLGCNAMSDRAIDNLLLLTYRPQEKGITTLCDSIDMITSYATIRYEAELKIMKYFMPGPLTMILESKHILSARLEQANGTIGVRIPDHEIALDIIRHYGNGIATKSANITGEIPPISFENIDPYFHQQKIMMIDGGTCPISVSSTIVRVDGEHDFTILRQGVISAADIQNIL